MAKRKRFALDVEEHPDASGGEIDRLFETQLATAQKPVVRDLATDRIHPNPFQARRSFDNIEELAQSMRMLGFITRLRVRPHPEQPGHFQLVFGERRWRAAIAAGLESIPCEIAPYPDEALLEMGLAENVQRQDLNPIEEAQAFKCFIEERGYTQQRLADRIGKDIAYVNRRLKLLDTPPDVQDLVIQRPDTIVVAREIARLTKPEQRHPLIEQVARGELSTREVQAIVQEATSRNVPVVADAPREEEVRTVDEQPRIPVTTNIQQAPSVVAGINLSLQRDVRAVRRIFASWSRDVAQLDDEHYSQLLAFMEEHLQEVQRLMEGLEQRR
jgi:ParB family chromosome partitioning protein